MKHLLTYQLFEGGNALELSRPIKQSEVPATLRAIEEVIFPALGISGWDVDAMLIGSAGKKSKPDDESGDIDIGIDIVSISDRLCVDESQVLKYIYDKLCREFPVFQSRWMRGVDVVSFGYPIANDPSKGYVQIDFIPLKDMNWSRFIYHCPDYRKNESSYKSSHRNWLFAAILSTITEDESFDEVDGTTKSYYGYMMRLQDGLSKFRKSYEGKRGRLKNPVKTHDDHVTSDPNEFVKFLFGEEVKPADCVTFESCWRIITAPGYKWSDNLPQITEAYKGFLKRVNLPVPKEIKYGNDRQS